MDEIIDIFDKNFQHLGSELKSKAHQDALDLFTGKVEKIAGLEFAE